MALERDELQHYLTLTIFPPRSFIIPGFKINEPGGFCKSHSSQWRRPFEGNLFHPATADWL